MLLGMFRRAASGGGGAPTDPDWASVVSLLKFNGANNSTTFTDERGHTWTRTGSPVISTAESVFGGASGLFATDTSDRIDASDASFALGTGDFCIECWVKPDADWNRAVFSFGSNLVYVASSNWAFFSGGNLILGGTVSTSAFQHVALSRESGTLRLFVGGALIGSTSFSTDLTGTALRIGWYNFGNPLGGYVDEFRVSKGVARYTAAFTPPSAPFPTS